MEHAAPDPRPPRMPPRWFVTTAWRVHRALFRATGGHVGLWRPRPGKWGTLRLTVPGRRTGRERSVLLGYVQEAKAESAVAALARMTASLSAVG